LDSFWNEEKEKKKRDSIAREGLCLPLRISERGRDVPSTFDEENCYSRDANPQADYPKGV
jgi:hypothetical protein